MQPLLSVEIRVACRCLNVRLWYNFMAHISICSSVKAMSFFKFSVISAKPSNTLVTLEHPEGHQIPVLKQWHPAYVENTSWLGWAHSKGRKERGAAGRTPWRHWLFLWKKILVCEGSPIKPSQQTSFNVDALLSLLGELHQHRSTHTDMAFSFGSILVLTELGGEEDTLHPQALLAPRFCLEGLHKAWLKSITSSPHAAITHVVTPTCCMQLLQCPAQGLGQETWGNLHLSSSSDRRTKGTKGPLGHKVLSSP